MDLEFPLEVDDGWPPVAVECIPCAEEQGSWRVQVAPLFVKDLSVGDLLEATLDDRRVTAWSHRERSAHTTIWLTRIADGADVTVLDELRALGCGVCTAEQLGMRSIDVPGTVPIGKRQRLTGADGRTAAGDQRVLCCLLRINHARYAAAVMS